MPLNRVFKTKKTPTILGRSPKNFQFWRVKPFDDYVEVLLVGTCISTYRPNADFAQFLHDKDLFPLADQFCNKLDEYGVVYDLAIHTTGAFSDWRSTIQESTYSLMICLMDSAAVFVRLM